MSKESDTLKTSKKVDEEKSFSWSKDEKDTSKKIYGCEIITERCSLEDIKNGNYPYDTYLISYMSGGKVFNDLTRSQKSVQLFDMYWDKFKHNLLSIKFANGKINPNSWNVKPTSKKKKK